MVKTYDLKEIDKLSINEVHDLYKKYVNKGQVDLLSSFSPARLKVKKSEGQYITLHDGRIISDFTAGIGVLNHGHNHPKILQVRKNFQEQKRMEVHKNFLSPYLAALAHSVSSVLPNNLEISYFCNSGAEAVEGALKLCFKKFDGKRNRILVSDIGFHGKLLGTGGLTFSPETSFNFPTIPNIDKFKFNDFDDLKKVVAQNIVNKKSQHYAILIEPFNASNVLECDNNFLKNTRELCDQYDIPLIFDEVYTGWAKTGNWFYFMNHNINPDVLSMSKSFGGGKSSISGFVSTTKLFESAYGNNIDATLHSTTYNGFGEECVTALESIKIIHEENLIERSNQIEKNLKSKLMELKNKYSNWISDIRGKGALFGIVLNSEIASILDKLIDVVPFGVLKDPNFRKKLVVSCVIHELFEKHNIMTYFGSNTDVPLIIAPTLKASDQDCTDFLKALDLIFQNNKLKLIFDFAVFKYGSKYLSE